MGISGHSSIYAHFNDEDYLDIVDLSELSDEDIAAPILENSSCSQRIGNRASPITQGISSAKASCAETITSNEDAHLQNQSGASFSDQVTCSKDDCLQLPGQDDMGFDHWFSSFHEETSVFGSPNLDMEFLLLKSVESSFDPIDGMQKAPYEPQHFVGNSAENSFINAHHEAICNSVESDKTVSAHISGGVENPCKGETLFPDTSLFPVPGRARSKRPRSAAKVRPSRMMLWGNGSSSPTDSLESKLSYFKPTLCTSGSSYFNCNNMKTVLSGEACNEVNIDSSSYKNGWLKVSRLSGKDQMLMHDDNGDTTHAQNVKYSAADDDENDGMNIDDSFSHQQNATMIRRCTHCLSHKTPQWRAGPAGPKTLCNACGMRFKSGRLFDEYRPAKSPTFLSYKHSNSHKRVLEMRCKKGLGTSQEQHHIYQRSRLRQCQQYQNNSCYSASASSLAAPSSSSMKLKINLNANAGNAPAQQAHSVGITFLATSNPSRLVDA